MACPYFPTWIEEDQVVGKTTWALALTQFLAGLPIAEAKVALAAVLEPAEVEGEVRSMKQS